jgi:hypothetical protein
MSDISKYISALTQPLCLFAERDKNTNNFAVLFDRVEEKYESMLLPIELLSLSLEPSSAAV